LHDLLEDMQRVARRHSAGAVETEE
jgi:hypothetical protein